jgi:hypothetical protein
MGYKIVRFRRFTKHIVFRFKTENSFLYGQGHVSNTSGEKKTRDSNNSSCCTNPEVDKELAKRELCKILRLHGLVWDKREESFIAR